MKVYSNSEIAPLRAALLGFMDQVKLNQPVNSVQRHYFKHSPPQLPLMIDQHQRLIETLEKQGVMVYRYDRQPENSDRPFARDAQAAIGDALFLCAMKNRSRPDLKEFLARIESPIIPIDQGILEGGDLLLERDILYIGLGERTDAEGVRQLTNNLASSVEIQLLPLKSDILHLDVALNFSGKNIALIYPPAFEELALSALQKRYRLFPVTAEEQFALGVNVLSLSPETVISEQKATRINDLLRQAGIEVIEVDYGEVIKLGGSFRCSVCSLIRDRI